MIAMTPILAIMILGTVNKIKAIQSGRIQPEIAAMDEQKVSLVQSGQGLADLHGLVCCTINRGYTEEVIELARSIGCQGATILHGRDARSGTWLSSSMDLEKEKEVIWFLTDAETGTKAARLLSSQTEPLADQIISVMALPVTQMAGLTLAPIKPELRD